MGSFPLRGWGQRVGGVIFTPLIPSSKGSWGPAQGWNNLFSLPTTLPCVPGAHAASQTPHLSNLCSRISAPPTLLRAAHSWGGQGRAGQAAHSSPWGCQNCFPPPRRGCNHSLLLSTPHSCSPAPTARRVLGGTQTGVLRRCLLLLYCSRPHLGARHPGGPGSPPHRAPSPRGFQRGPSPGGGSVPSPG